MYIRTPYGNMLLMHLHPYTLWKLVFDGTYIRTSNGNMLLMHLHPYTLWKLAFDGTYIRTSNGNMLLMVPTSVHLMETGF